MRRLATSVLASYLMILLFTSLVLWAALKLPELAGPAFGRTFFLFLGSMVLVTVLAGLFPFRAIRVLANERDVLVERLSQGRAAAIAGPYAELARRINKLIEENRDLAAHAAAASAGADRAARLAAIGRLASGLAHEIRNPLTTVIGMAALARETCDDDRLRIDLKSIEDEARRCEAITESILAFSRTPRLNRTTVDLRMLLVAPEGVELEVEVAAEAARIHGDSTLLGRVFANLLTNARDAGATRISVTISRSGSQVRVLVQDDGRGIPAALLQELFDPFVTSRAGGLGLGLAITRGVVHAHGGTITARNRTVGGAEFELLLPVTGSSAGAEIIPPRTAGVL